MSTLEELKQHNNAKLDLGTECIWKLDLDVLEVMYPNNVTNTSTSEGNWCFNGDMTSTMCMLLPHCPTHILLL